MFLLSPKTFAAEAAKAGSCSIALFELDSTSGSKTGFRELFDLYRQNHLPKESSSANEETALRQETTRILTYAPESMPHELKIPGLNTLTANELELAMKPILMSVLSKRFPNMRASSLAARLLELRRILAFEDVIAVSATKSIRRYMKIRTPQLIKILELKQKANLSNEDLLHLFNQTMLNFDYSNKRYLEASIEEQDFRMYEAFIFNLENLRERRL